MLLTEAEVLLAKADSNHLDAYRTFLAATTQLQIAVSNMQDAQNHSMKVEFKVGRVRHMI